MKIYPSKHQIRQVQSVNLSTDIPLGYVDTDSKDYICSFESNIKPTGITAVLPYQKFSSYDIKLFKPSKGTAGKQSSDFYEIDHKQFMQRDGEFYKYVPKNVVTFSPQEFSYTVTCKKNIPYDIFETYNIKAACIDNPEKPEEERLSNMLMKVFGDAPQRGICPSNVWINNKDMSSKSLTSSTIRANDIVFVQSPDGKKIKVAGQNSGEYADADIDIDNIFLKRMTNVWVSVDNFPIATSKKIVTIKRPLLNSEVSVMTDSFSTELKTDFSIGDSENDGLIIHELFSGENTVAIIKEYKNKGFVIYTPKSFFGDLNTNVKILYEIMMFVFGNCYVESKPHTQWISDVIPDYVIENRNISTIDKFMSRKKLHEFFDMKQNEVMLSSIKISSGNIKMIGLVNEYLTFSKSIDGENVIYADPKKPNESMISIYNQNKQIVFFDEMTYSIGDNPIDFLTWERDNDKIVVRALGFKDTENNINIKDEKLGTTEIPLIITSNYNTTSINDEFFYICAIDDMLSSCKKGEYSESLGKIIATINISKSSDMTVIYDMRQRGGGLPEDFEDANDLLDIGYIKGSPYRKSGAIIFTFPERLKSNKEEIEKIVRKHMVAEKYPIIIFEESEV